MSFPIEWAGVLEAKGLVAETPPVFPDEKAFMAAVTKLARDHDYLVYHTHDARRSEKGFPDLVIVASDRVIFAELKMDGGKVSPEQVVWGAALCAVGGNVKFVVWRPAHWDLIRLELA